MLPAESVAFFQDDDGFDPFEKLVSVRDFAPARHPVLANFHFAPVVPVVGEPARVHRPDLEEVAGQREDAQQVRQLL